MLKSLASVIILVFFLAGCIPPTVAPLPAPPPILLPTSTPRPAFIPEVAYGSHPFQRMDIYYPASQSPVMPVVVYVHGGGWVEGDKSSPEAKSYIDELLKRGYAIFSLNYRLAPEYPFPAQIEDVKSAIRFIRAHSDEYAIDSRKMGIFGSSAGGHLSSLAGVTSPQDGFDKGDNLEQSSRVDAVVDLFGPVDINAFTAAWGVPDVFAQTFGQHEPPAKEYTIASATTYIDAGDPPFLIFHGDRDRMVPTNQSRLLNEALKKAGVSSEVVIVKGGQHGFVDAESGIDPSNAEITQMIADFFDNYLKQSAP